MNLPKNEASLEDVRRSSINKQPYKELLENDEKTLLAYMAAMQRESTEDMRSVMINIRILTWIVLIGIILGIFSTITLY